jgi:DMSO/TMAO reductase YedYZ heme-binding membrane subunit
MESHERVSSALGAGVTNSAYLLGVLMAVLFLILWVTSFDAIHKRLGAVRWKKIQRWSYVLYAMLFVHSLLLGIGGLLNGGGGHGRGRGEDMTLVMTVGIISTCLVFISYLILRLRKMRRDAK